MDNQPNAKTGAFPTADKAAVFGEAFTKFYDKWSLKGRLEDVWPEYSRIRSWAKPRADRDPEFRTWYPAFIRDKKLTISDLDAIIMQLVAALERLGMWDYGATPHYTDNDAKEAFIGPEGMAANP